jgi:hypothetical protein
LAVDRTFFFSLIFSCVDFFSQHYTLPTCNLVTLFFCAFCCCCCCLPSCFLLAALFLTYFLFHLFSARYRDHISKGPAKVAEEVLAEVRCWRLASFAVSMFVLYHVFFLLSPLTATWIMYIAFHCKTIRACQPTFVSVSDSRTSAVVHEAA